MTVKPPIQMLNATFDVSMALEQIAQHPELWNHYAHRTYAGGAHRQVDDIWVRYNDFANYAANPDFFVGEHDSVWYPDSAKIPAVKGLCMELMATVGGERLGGVLITRIPPGGGVEPHVDHGWHAGYYEKFAIQLMGTEDQAFCFDGYTVSALPGQCYTFDNSRKHWVTNSSNVPRMTLICCVRGANCVELA